MCLCITPHFSYGQALSPQKEAEMITVIQALRAQVATLVALLNAQHSEFSQATVVRGQKIEQSAYYTGVYEAVYDARGYTLIPEYGTSVDGDHEEVWEMFVEITGEQYVREQVRQFRVYRDEDAPYDAYIDYLGGGWVLGFNMFDLDLTSRSDKHLVEELLVHEYGHIVLGDRADILASFADTFWSVALQNAAARAHASSPVVQGRQAELRYRASPESYVSEYAATNPLEDAVESFTAFLYDEVPPSYGTKRNKVRFFEQYSELRHVRDRLENVLW